MEQPLKPQAKPNSLRFLAESQRDYVAALVDLERKVHNARRCGASWSEIGAILGTSKQAAQQRYGKGPSKELIAADHAEDAPAVAAHAKAQADHAAHIEATATFLDGTAPAGGYTVITGITVDPKHPKASKPGASGTPTNENGRPLRPGRKIPGDIPETAEPGIGTGAHACISCGKNNHKGVTPAYAYFYDDCAPTKYDPPYIAKFIMESNA